MNNTQMIKIWVEGGHEDARALAQTLQDDGFDVEHRPPAYLGRRQWRGYWDLDFSTDIQQLVVNVVGTVAGVGLIATVKASVSEYRKHNSRAVVTIEGVHEEPGDRQDEAAEQEGSAPPAGHEG